MTMQYLCFFAVAEFAFTQSVYSIIEDNTDLQITIELIRGILTFDINVTVETTNTGTATGKATINVFQLAKIASYLPPYD